MQLLFDLDRSLKVNPPNYAKGINHIRREAGRLEDLITKDENGVSLQPREKEKETGATLKNSFMANGVLYDRQPMVAEQRKDGKKELITGFNRHPNLLDLNVTHYFWDLVTFDSPLDKVIAKRSLNATNDHVAKGTPNNDNDYLLGLREANKITPNLDDKAMRRLLRNMSNDTLSKYQIDLILKKYYKSNSLHGNVVALDTPSANKILKSLELPYKGYVKNLSSSCYGRIGFAKDVTNPLSQIPSWVELYDMYGVPIELYCFVQNLNPANIRAQRQEVVNKIGLAQNWIKKYCPKRFRTMLDIKGHIAQISTPNPLDGGKRKERGIVDIDGNIIIDTPDGL